VISVHGRNRRAPITSNSFHFIVDIYYKSRDANKLLYRLRLAVLRTTEYYAPVEGCVCVCERERERERERESSQGHDKMRLLLRLETPVA